MSFQITDIVLYGPEVRLTYCVHLYQDWIESIRFDKEDVTLGEWTFSYPVSDEAGPHRLPAAPSRHDGRVQNITRGLWLMHLAQGNLVQ